MKRAALPSPCIHRCLLNLTQLLALLVFISCFSQSSSATTEIEHDAANTPLLSKAEQEWLEAHPQIRLGIDRAWKPFEFFDQNNHYSGIAAEYIELLNTMLSTHMAPAGIFDWSEVIEMAQRGEIDVLPCVVNTSQRREYLLFTDTYLNFPMIIATREDASFLSGLEMLKHKRLGVVDGYATIDLISVEHPTVELIRFATLEEGLAALSTGKIDAFADNLATITYAIKETGITNLKIAATTPYDFELAIGVRKDWPELVTILNKALDAISIQQRDQIRQNWISMKFEHGEDLPWIIRALLIVSLIGLVIIALVTYWNRSLSNEVNRRIDAEQRLLQRNAVLQSMTSGNCLQDTLNIMIQSIEQASPGLRCSILIADVKKQALYLGAAPSLPDFYNRAIHGVTYGPGIGSCGTAAASRELVIVEDIQQHPYWQDYKDLAARAGLRACWSQPIMSAGDTLLGTFACYYDSVQAPGRKELTLIREYASLASVVIDHYQIGESVKQLSLAVKYSPNAVLITNIHDEIEYVNPKFTEITGFSAAEVLGQPPSILNSGETNPAVYQAMRKTLQEGQEWHGEVHNRRKNGDDYWAEVHVAPITNETGQVTHFVELQQDITETRRIHEEISYQASHDLLTDLINRREFERRLHRVVQTAKKDHSNHALCFLDLDQFKILNDTCGHIAGDELLRQLSRLMREKLRKRDTLARIGGDEFSILMEHCEPEHALRSAEQIRHLVEDFRFQWDGHVFNPGVSIGLTTIDRNSKDASEVLKKADTACYAAKDAGRNCIHVYNEDDQLLIQRRGDFRLVQEIKLALENDSFQLYAQCIVPLSSDQSLTAYEVLLRLRDKSGELIMPGGFLPTAERYNLSIDIDLWVINHVFEWLQSNLDKLEHISSIAINLSGVSLGSERLLRHTVAWLESGHIPNGMIYFEITETIAIANLTEAQNFIRTLRQYGCQFALDDFGSGLSSFAYLKNLPVERLKIDGMFVKDILLDPIDAAMVESINEIGHVMGMTTVAEFVESKEIEQALRNIGIDYVQGYAVGRPVPIESILLGNTDMTDNAVENS